MTEAASLVFPPSFAQQRLWFLEQLDPGKSVYNILYAVRFEARINRRALTESIREIGRRHESLRTRFATVDGQPVQVIEPDSTVTLQVADFSGLPKAEQDRAVQREAQRQGTQPFDLTAGPLLRAHLLLLEEDRSVLLIAVHHIVIDGWSVGVVFQELAALYDAFSNHRPSPLPDPNVQYADYSEWQREWLQSGALESQIAFWRQSLTGAPAALDLATDRQRPAVQTFQGARRYTELPPGLTERLRAFSRREGVTLFMTLLAAFDVLLWRYSGQDDVVVGTPLAGRVRSELEGIVGLFANTLPVRTDLSGNPPFRELLARVREVALDVYAHQDVPLDRLVEELKPDRSLSHTPLFQVVFALENTPQPVQLPGLSMQWMEVDRGTARADLSLFASDKGSGVNCMWEYSTDLFDRDTIERMMLNYQAILESALENPAGPIALLSTCAPAERRRLLVEWNAAKSEAPGAICMHQQFEAQAERRPHAPAVVFAGRRLTYGELNTRSNQLAHYLRGRGVGPETRVGVCLERSETMIVALLAVLKAGGAYVPLDPGYPAERLAFMLEDARVAVLITEQRLLRLLPARPEHTVCLDDCPALVEESLTNPSSGVAAEHLAYVIYTSGSTGRPKGVEVTHRAVVHLFAATRDKLGFRDGDVWTVVHSSGFDFSVWEIWGSLLQGGTLLVVPLPTVQSSPELYELLCRERVTVASLTPSALRALLDARRHALSQHQRDWAIRVMVCGGDALDTELADELVQLVIPVWNFYGPTESTVWATCGRTAAEGTEPSTSIGRPLADIEIYLVDRYLQPVPIGVPGELLIGGAGLARGYLNRPQLTAERFVPDPFSGRAGARLYRTGDLARYHASGRLEFLGRLDHQVKLRGFRIELGEIETLLSAHPNVAQAVVMVRGDRAEDRKLVAYLVPDGAAPKADDLRQCLRRSLPEYMVPSAFVTLDAMPLSANRKVDRKALPAPDASPAAASAVAVPRNPVEEMLALIWANVLGCDSVGIHDNFFDIGGHSLLATRVVSRLRDTFQIDMPLRALFEAPTIAALGEHVGRALETREGLRAAPIVRVTRHERLPLSFAQQRLWFLDQLEPGNPFYNVSRALRIRGALDADALARAISEIVRRHEALRTVFGSEHGTPFQTVNTPRAVPLTLADLTHHPEALREAEAARTAAASIRAVFDLSCDLLFRATLLKIAAGDHVLVLTTHHITADGWSLAILFRELTVLYEGMAAGTGSPLEELPIQYADFAVWQREWLQGDVLARLTAFWREALAGAPPALELPADKPRPAVQTFRGARAPFALPPALGDALNTLSREAGVTLFMTCLAAFQLLLSRRTGRDDVVVGTDVACRSRSELEPLIGFFTNLIPLRTTLAGNPTFTQLLARVRTTALNAYAHQELPFDKLVEALRPPRDRARNPIVQVLIVMQNETSQPFTLPDLTVSRFDLPIESSRFDLVLFLRESPDLAGMWLYNPDLFEAGTIARLSDDYRRLLDAVVRTPAAPLETLDVRGEEEEKQKQMEKKDYEQAQISRLRTMRRKSVDLSQMSGIRTRLFDPDQPLPLVVEPDSVDVDLVDWAASHKDFVETHMRKHGAVLFRGFAVESAVEFERVVSAICSETFDEYGDLPREPMGGKVYSSTPYPADETILFHNEGSHQHRWPMRISFYCVKASQQGGESPVVDCRRMYEALDPAIRERFESKGVIYVRNFTEGLDVSWQQFFHTSDRAAVEEYCRNGSFEYEWTRNNGLRTRLHCPAVVTHPQTGEKVFFNQVQLHHPSCLSPAVRESLLSMVDEEDLPRNVYYGDGSKIEDGVMEDLGVLYRQLASSFPWRERDVLLINNMLVAHSRNPFVGERKIVVALSEVVAQERIEPRQHLTR
ncbi:MAG: amino acid adenylation domain-containing protein [Vicinamibacterales bacterium]